MRGAVKKRAWGVPYWQGTIRGKPVVVAITGIGKTFTGATSTLCAKYSDGVTRRNVPEVDAGL